MSLADLIACERKEIMRGRDTAGIPYTAESVERFAIACVWSSALMEHFWSLDHDRRNYGLQQCLSCLNRLVHHWSITPGATLDAEVVTLLNRLAVIEPSPSGRRIYALCRDWYGAEWM